MNADTLAEIKKQCEKIVPRCSKCHKRVGNWLKGTASYTCRECKTEFIVGQGFVTIICADNITVQGQAIKMPITAIPDFRPGAEIRYIIDKVQ